MGTKKDTPVALPRLADDGTAPSGYLAVELRGKRYALPWNAKLTPRQLRALKDLDEGEKVLYMIELWAGYQGMDFLLDVPMDELSEALSSALEAAEEDAKKEG